MEVSVNMYSRLDTCLTPVVLYLPVVDNLSANKTIIIAKLFVYYIIRIIQVRVATLVVKQKNGIRIANSLPTSKRLDAI